MRKVLATVTVLLSLTSTASAMPDWPEFQEMTRFAKAAKCLKFNDQTTANRAYHYVLSKQTTNVSRQDLFQNELMTTYYTTHARTVDCTGVDTSIIEILWKPSWSPTKPAWNQ